MCMIIRYFRANFIANILVDARYGIDFVADGIEDDNSGIYAHN